MAKIFDQRCTNKECGCNKPRSFWIELDEDGEPTGELCWAYFADDKPTIGEWIEVQEITKKK